MASQLSIAIYCKGRSGLVIDINRQTDILLLKCFCYAEDVIVSPEYQGS